ncbi:MAG: hypothetical protein CVU57_12255 [Deltaproteobacteria bacterium HGW-Deltaproteobacteria-15]|nr:MAG: hypothetical protein CVU57_12255 [Deltaproteobacteria bacterium HGW-Deltaproteobacteria-15]
MGKLPRNLFFYITLFLLGCLLCVGPALSQENAGIKIPLNQYGIQTTNPYVVDRFVWNGKLVDKVIVPGRPPAIVKARAVQLPVQSAAAGTNTLSSVPALEWAFGCSATSAAMMFGYYDNVGYSNMYSGPANDGVFPMTNAAWPHVTISGEDRAQCPLSATRSGLDGRVIYGHVDDYWIMSGNSDPDPFIGNWAEHIQGECTADYMGTSQSAFGNTDGSTSFYYYPDGARLFDYTGSEPTDRDGCHGLKLFVESRGYQVVSNFSQYIYGYNGNTQGFTFAEYKAEIDAGRPVLIHVVGHTMLGFGYNDSVTIVYLHNTWDNSDHEMAWGGSYSEMAHFGVTVLQLEKSLPTVTTTAVTNITTNSAETGGNITSEGGGLVTERGVCWNTSPNPTTGNSRTQDGTGVGEFTSSMTGLTADTTYHVRAYATNSAGTAYGEDLTFSTDQGSFYFIPSKTGGGAVIYLE